MKRFIILIVSFLLFTATAFAHSDSVRVVRSIKTNSPTIDGILESEWWKAPLATNFIQREPEEGEPSTQQTDVRIMHSDKAIYVAFRCYEEDPSLIESKLTKRDEIWDSDRVVIWLDTYHDHRNAFVFGTNPYGIMYDGNFYNDDWEDSKWDGYWEVATTVDDSGWIAEFKIPFSTLRFNESEGEQTWGFNAFRNIEHNKEWAYWQQVTRDMHERVSELGHLEGLFDIKPGRGLELRPYAITNFEEEGLTPLQGHNDWENIGLDVKYRLASNLTLDATLNPDFAQIEADDEVINLSDYPVYLREKRPFFMEGASLFEGRMELFYSRRITNPQAGAKITGKLDGTQMAAIAARNINEDDEIEDFGILRLKRDIFERSDAGILLTDKEGPGGDYARVWSVDANFKLGESYGLEMQIAQSFKPEFHNDNWAYSVGGYRSADLISGSFWASGRTRNFRGNDAGWIGATDYHNVGTWMQWAPRPEKWGIRKVYNNVNAGLEWNIGGKYAEQWWNYNNSFQTMNYWWFGFGFAQNDYWRRNYVDDDEEESYQYTDNFGNFNMENYSGSDFWIWFETDYTKQFAFDIGHSQGDFRDGYEREVWGGIQWRPKDNINLRYSSELDRVVSVSDIEDGAKTDFIVSRFKMEWTLSLNLFTRLNVQYVHEDEVFYTNALIGYKFAPESYFYLVYDDDRSELLGWETVQDRKIKAKIVYFVQI